MVQCKRCLAVVEIAETHTCPSPFQRPLKVVPVDNRFKPGGVRYDIPELGVKIRPVFGLPQAKQDIVAEWVKMTLTEAYKNDPSIKALIEG